MWKTSAFLVLGLALAGCNDSPDLSLQLTGHQLGGLGGLDLRVVKIVNRTTEPVVLQKVLLNGTFEARRIDPLAKLEPGALDKAQWPATLSLGDSALAYVNVPALAGLRERQLPGTFDKEVIFVEVVTDRGTASFNADGSKRN